jgi:hypothetical protein
MTPPTSLQTAKAPQQTKTNSCCLLACLRPVNRAHSENHHPNTDHAPPSNERDPLLRRPPSQHRPRTSHARLHTLVTPQWSIECHWRRTMTRIGPSPPSARHSRARTRSHGAATYGATTLKPFSACVTVSKSSRRRTRSTLVLNSRLSNLLLRGVSLVQIK